MNDIERQIKSLSKKIGWILFTTNCLFGWIIGDILFKLSN